MSALIGFEGREIVCILLRRLKLDKTILLELVHHSVVFRPDVAAYFPQFPRKLLGLG